MSSRRPPDHYLLFTIGALVFLGLFIFASAALGPLARGATTISSIVFNHLFFGIGLGLTAMIFASLIHYRIWRQYAPYLFGLGLFITALVFIPGIGLEANGAARWLQIGPFTFQPAEALKVAVILFFAAYLTSQRNRLNNIRYGLGGFLLILSAPAALLLLQPDTGTLGVIVFSMGAMFLAAGARWKDMGLILLIGIIALGALTLVRPHVLDRMTTFINPSLDQQGIGYQLKQSLIAIGSGGVTGRGFGQSVQKFSYLPEPMSDSIFAVASEEFGMLGAFVIIALFLGFGARGLWLAARTPDYFGGLVMVGIVTMIVGQAFMNIASMIGIVPLTGIPLVFISQGGTAMLIALGSVGILLNISRYIKK